MGSQQLMHVCGALMDSRWPAVAGDFHSPLTLTVHEERPPIGEQRLLLRVAEMTLKSP